MALIPRSRHVWFACFISDANGSWQEVTDALCGAEVSLGDTSGVGTGQTGADSSVRSATITFRSSRVRLDSKDDTTSASEALVIGDETSIIGDSVDSGVKLLDALFPGSVTSWPGDSLHPMDKNSVRNKVAGVYSPLIAPGHEIVLKYAVTNPGVYPAPTTWKTLFHGILGDQISDDGSALVSVQCRDLSKRLQDCFIEELREYGSDAGGELAESVIQKILDDNLGANAPVLNVLSPTTSQQFRVKKYQLQYGTVWDGIQQIATALGWWLGYKYDAASNSFKLSLLEPPRTKTDSDYFLTWTDDFYKHDLAMSDRSIRNAVKVTFRNTATGKRESVTVEDAASILAYGRRAMGIEEGDSSMIDSTEEATEFANAALSDLKLLIAQTNVEMPFAPFLDIFTAVAIEDPRIHTESSVVAINSISHRFILDGDKMTCRTTIAGCERVVGGLNRWLVMQTRPGAPGNPVTGKDFVSQEIIPAPTWLSGSPVVGVDVAGYESNAYIVLGWKKPEGNYFPARYLVRYRPTGTQSWTETAVGADTVTTGISTDPHIEYRISGLLPNIQYDVQIQPVSVEGVLGINLDLASGAVTPKDSTPPPAPTVSASGANGILAVSCGVPGANDSDVRLCVVSLSPGFDADARVWYDNEAVYLGAADGYSSVIEYQGSSRLSNPVLNSSHVTKFPEYFSPGAFMTMEFWAKGTLIPVWEGVGQWVEKPEISPSEYRKYVLRSDGTSGYGEYFRFFYPTGTTGQWVRMADAKIYKDTSPTINHLGPNTVVRVAAGKQTRFDIGDLEPGTTYYVKVADVDTSKNISEWSTEASSKIAHAAPLVLSGVATANNEVLFGDMNVFYDEQPSLLLAPSHVSTFNGAQNTASQTLKIWADPPTGKTLKEGFIPRVQVVATAGVHEEAWTPSFSSNQDNHSFYNVASTPSTSAPATRISFKLSLHCAYSYYSWMNGRVWATVKILSPIGTILWAKDYSIDARQHDQSFDETVDIKDGSICYIAVTYWETSTTDYDSWVSISNVVWVATSEVFSTTGDIQWIAINRS